ncbi:MAG: RodZ domain-containing protein, partial [Candidatus Limnocylindria bacterium]
FLRNYGAYLGLDPEYLIDLYRLETTAVASERPAAPAPPRPIAVRRRRAFVVSPGAVVGTILTLAVGALVIWIGYEIFNFARTPELRVVAPAGDVAAHTADTITMIGVTSPNATITVDGLRENPSVTADETGNFEVTVNLVPGSNVIELTALDPVTDRTSATVVRTVQVVSEVAASPTPQVVPLALTQPANEATLSGPVVVTGTGPPGTALQLTAALVTAPTPTFGVTDAGGTAVTVTPVPPTPPAAATLGIDATGAFTGTLALPSGTWDVSVAATAGEPVTRRVAVQPGAGLTGTLRLEGGQSYIEIDQDGVALSGTSGSIADDGESVNLAATREVRILAGNAGAIRVTMNGVDIGPMGAAGAVVEWRITRSGS